MSKKRLTKAERIKDIVHEIKLEGAALERCYRRITDAQNNECLLKTRLAELDNQLNNELGIK